MIDFICDNNKYTFNDKSLTISLPVSNFNLPNKIKLEENDLCLKSNFHITLVPIGKIIEKNNLKIENLSNFILKDFCDFISFNSIDLIEYSNEYRFVQEKDLRTIVVMCKVSNLDKFFKLINQKYNINIETPPTHVTLYTLYDKLGIFILDNDDLYLKTKIINDFNLR